MRTLSRTAGVAAVLLVVGFLGSTPASAEGNGQWSLKPASADGSTGSRSFFDHQVEPGHAVRDLARLANLTDAPLTFNLYAADAYTTDDGGFALHLAADPRNGVGSWVSLPTDSITVPAGQAVNFPIQIGVPADATPGDWAGGVVASVAAPADESEGPPGLVIEQGVAARIYVRVEGALAPSLEVDDVALDVGSVSWAPIGHPARARVSYDVANTGNTRITGEAHLEITDTFGRTVKTAPDQIFTDLLPGEDVTFTETLAGLPATGLRYRAHVAATAQDVTAEASSSAAWNPPVLLVVAVLAVVAVVGPRVRRRRRA